MPKNNFWYAVATLVGGTVGVGIFGIPFVFVKAGFLPGILFLVGLTAVVMLLNAMYGEVILRTSTKHQMLGYVQKYLGSGARDILLLTFVLSVYGAMLSYIIISGTFLSNFFSFFSYSSPAFFSTLFFIVGATLLLMGVRRVSKFDLLMLGFFVILIFSVAVLSIRHIDIHNYALLTKEFWFLPFGVIFFALSGMVALPLAREVLDIAPDGQGMTSGRKFKKVIMVGTAIPAILCLVFVLAVVGVSGDATSPEAVSGLAFFLGERIVLIGSLFGILSITTSFLGMGLALSESFQYDFKFSKLRAWLLVVVPPYFLFLLGLRNFIDVMKLVGGLALSVEGIFLLFLYMQARKKGDRIPEYSVRVAQPVIYLLMAVFAFAAIYTLVT